MIARVSLLESVQSLLERTYRMRADLGDVGRFVIGDAGYRSLYGAERPVETVGAVAAPPGARTLVRETAGGMRACIYFPDAMILRLESHPPQRGLDDDNVDEFAVLVEELDHLLVLADRAGADRPVSLFELELHAYVSKHLVLSRYLAGASRALDDRRRAWLRYHLFHKGMPDHDDGAVRDRYREAQRWAVRLVEGMTRLRPARRVEVLRRFHEASAAGKLALIRTLAA
jgi:hypothetical protein